jgi:hydrogenase maturation protein HypF
VREPWRVAAAALGRAGAAPLLPLLPLADLVPTRRLEEVARLAERPTWPLATGAGRLFEAAGALLGLVAANSWEGEAAARLEALASRVEEVQPWAECRLAPDSRVLPSLGLLAATARRVLDGEAEASVAAGFHTTFCRLAVDLTLAVAGDRRRVVALGGGCMVNRLLLEGMTRGLANAGFEPLVPRRLPPGDGGLAYGQAVVAAVALARGVEPRPVG